MNPKTLGDQIKVKRYERSLSLDDVASKLGVEAALVKGWENDQVKPNESAWKALAPILGLTDTTSETGNPA